MKVNCNLTALTNETIQHFRIRVNRGRLFIPTHISLSEIYNLDSLPLNRDSLIVVFGIAHVFKLWQSGFPDVVGLLKQTITKRQVERIRSTTKRNAVIWVVTDGNGLALQDGVKVSGQLAQFRFVRHIFFTSKTILNSSKEEIQILFSQS